MKNAIVALKSQRDFTDPDARVLKTADGRAKFFMVAGLENTVNVFRTFRDAVDERLLTHAPRTAPGAGDWKEANQASVRYDESHCQRSCSIS